MLTPTALSIRVCVFATLCVCCRKGASYASGGLSNKNYYPLNNNRTPQFGISLRSSGQEECRYKNEHVGGKQ
ncbi:hypothetical protein BX661DRAFT_177020 [Kickxella alabastrina]|uniref:uncharacterized protein n=1 Tax=Kickxella alabastrina TaxID=61397 RepID=UPI00221F54FB|nr:uncharacterized protein BX661DRAFT_177020 [Kickxella alabastrina]KAI7834331.1 hypothetical protein BX661DRAFT_177020 [Kickxella alabastrina]